MERAILPKQMLSVVCLRKKETQSRDRVWIVYPLITESLLTPEPNISRSCRTKCTNLNPSDPPNPLTKKWCITDPYYPSVKLSGKSIKFPLKDDDFDNSGSHIDRTFWEWGFCDEKSCNNDLSWVPSPVKINKYPKTTGQ